MSARLQCSIALLHDAREPTNPLVPATFVFVPIKTQQTDSRWRVRDDRVQRIFREGLKNFDRVAVEDVIIHDEPFERVFRVS